MKKFALKFSILFLIISISFFYKNKYLYADSTIISRANWGADESITNTDQEDFMQVEDIRLVEIDAPNSNISLNTEDWTRGLYYYFTQEDGMKDIPFNYLVGWDGRIYQGVQGSMDVQVQSTDKLGTLVIGYLSNGKSLQTNDDITNLLKTLLSKYDLNINYVIPSDWSIVQSNGKDYIQFVNSQNSDWNNIVNNIKTSLGYNPNSQSSLLQLPHSVKVSNISFCNSGSSCEVSGGQILTVSLNIENTGNLNIYSPLKIVANPTNNKNNSNKGSLMYDSGSWEDDLTAGLISTSRIEPNESRTITYKVKVPSSKSNWQEKFYLTVEGNKINGSDFTLDLTK